MQYLPSGSLLCCSQFWGDNKWYSASGASKVFSMRVLCMVPWLSSILNFQVPFCLILEDHLVLLHCIFVVVPQSLVCFLWCWLSSSSLMRWDMILVSNLLCGFSCLLMNCRLCVHGFHFIFIIFSVFLGFYVTNALSFVIFEVIFSSSFFCLKLIWWFFPWYGNSIGL